MAAMPVVEPVAVAGVEALLAAILPDRELDEPRENGREGRIERTGVNLLGSTGNDFGAAACPVAAGAARVGSLEAPQDPSPVQKIVDQGIDRNQVHADFQPPRANVGGADQNARHRHCQDLGQLPSGIDEDKIEATFKKGVLKVTLPKSGEAQKAEKKIPVKAA